jgi:hypothetical protein
LIRSFTVSLKSRTILGEKLFPAVLHILGEYKSSLAFRDMLNQLEKLEIIPSEKKWMDYREIRNTLTHDYPDNEDEIIEGIKLSLIAYKEIKELYDHLKLRFSGEHGQSTHRKKTDS